MFKKIITAILTCTILFSPLGSSLVHDQQTVSAKGYKSGIKKFNGGSNFQFNKKQSTTINKKNSYFNNKSTTSMKNRGFMKGMLYGGLSGFLLGGLLSHFGPFGAMLGFGVNLIGIILLFVIIRFLFTSMRRKRY
ncbi:hypothetical protein ACE38V_09710 [Cytobacillus sp. Hz8]|uniref:hypothetical protein n=1 Tax=Cytobacillus sp. Hz8 TaxID=3347168 RepID=UPI0035D96482